MTKSIFNRILVLDVQKILNRSGEIKTLSSSHAEGACEDEKGKGRKSESLLVVNEPNKVPGCQWNIILWCSQCSNTYSLCNQMENCDQAGNIRIRKRITKSGYFETCLKSIR